MYMYVYDGGWRYLNMIPMNDTDTWIYVYVYIWWGIYMTETDEYVVMCMNVVWTEMLVYDMSIRLIETDKYVLLT